MPNGKDLSMESKSSLNLKRLQTDIVKAAQIAEVPYDKEKIWEVLKAYEELLRAKGKRKMSLGGKYGSQWRDYV